MNKRVAKKILKNKDKANKLNYNLNQIRKAESLIGRMKRKQERKAEQTTAA